MLHLHKVYKGAYTVYCYRVLSVITDPAVTRLYQTYVGRLSTVFTDRRLLISNLVRYCLLLSVVCLFLVSIGVLPSDFFACYVLCLLLKCFFSLTSHLTDNTIDTQLFLRPQLGPHKTRSVTHTKGVTHSHFGYKGEIIAHSRCGCDSLSLAAWRH